MQDWQWNKLVDRIRSGNCTPFLGAGACAPILPMGGQIAEEWSKEHDYPLEDTHDLARVSQYLAVSQDAMSPKELIDRRLSGLGPPDFSQPDEPHRLLADLSLPLYLTTNYDDFMARALQARGRNVRQEVCKWNDSPRVRADPSPLAEDYDGPTPDNPVVFHMHGRLGLTESMVLTEDDYLEFLIGITKADEESFLPAQVVTALYSTSLLFIGYALADWDFRVLHRGFVVRGNPALRRVSVTIQLPKTAEAQAYVDRYFDAQSLTVFWGDAREFCRELRQRWEAAGGA